MASRPKLQVKTRSRLPTLRLAFFLTLLLTCFSLLPWVRVNPRLAGSFWAASGALLLFTFILRRQVAKTRRALSIEVVPRPVHYVQLGMQTSIYIDWGWYWREVYHYAPLILAQIIFVSERDRKRIRTGGGAAPHPARRFRAVRHDSLAGLLPSGNGGSARPEGQPGVLPLPPPQARTSHANAVELTDFLSGSAPSAPMMKTTPHAYGVDDNACASFLPMARLRRG